MRPGALLRVRVRKSKGVPGSRDAAVEWSVGLCHGDDAPGQRRSGISTRWPVTIAGRQFWRWRAVDDEGEVLDLLPQRRRDRAAAVKLMRKLLKKQGFAPDVMVTDKRRSHGQHRARCSAPPLQRLTQARWRPRAPQTVRRDLSRAEPDRLPLRVAHRNATTAAGESLYGLGSARASVAAFVVTAVAGGAKM
jgi:DDE domain